MIKFNISFPLAKPGLKIVRALQSHGFEAFWVGGTVRDVILNRPITNVDIATSATPSKVIEILNSHKIQNKPVGIEFGTVLAITSAGPVEITTFRTEGEYINRRKPKSVQYITDYIIDSKRRDLTINALYYDPVKKVLHDPQDGLKHLKQGLLKFVGDPKKRIDEDALRMIRAVRFATQFGYKIEKNSFAAIKTRAKYINQIAGERVRNELDKILLSDNRIEGVRLLDRIGLLKFIMPEVWALKTVFHKSNEYHLEGSVFEHTLLVLHNITVKNLPLAYAALYHDVGKATTATPKKKKGGVVNSFPAHEFVSCEMFKKLASRLKISRKDTDLVLWITKLHMSRIAFIKDMSFDKKISLVQHKYFSQLIQFWRADSLSNMIKIDNEIVESPPLAYRQGLQLLKKTQYKSKLIKQLTNGELIILLTKQKPGPQIKKLKLIILENILTNKISNLTSLKKFLKNYTKNT